MKKPIIAGRAELALIGASLCVNARARAPRARATGIVTAAGIVITNEAAGTAACFWGGGYACD